MWGRPPATCANVAPPATETKMGGEFAAATPLPKSPADEYPRQLVAPPGTETKMVGEFAAAPPLPNSPAYEYPRQLAAPAADRPQIIPPVMNSPADVALLVVPMRSGVRVHVLLVPPWQSALSVPPT